MYIKKINNWCNMIKSKKEKKYINKLLKYKIVFKFLKKYNKK